MKHPTVSVTCGNLVGTLHLDRFMCPGIHSLCIEYGGQMVTPKKFTILGEKQSLKDWKKALRVNKIPLRDIMDKGYIDFAVHDQSCTGKCLGRTPSKSMSPVLSELKYSSQMTSSAVSKMLDMSMEAGSPGSGTGPIITEVLGGQEDTYSNIANGGDLAPSSPPSATPNQLFLNNLNKPVVYVVGKQSTPMPGVRIKSEPLSPEASPKPDCLPEEEEDMGARNCGIDKLMELADKQHSAYKPITDSVTDSLKFWDGIIALGLMDDFVKEIKISLDLLKMRLVNPSGDIETDAMKLSNVVKDLGLFKVLQEKMVDLQQETQQQQFRLNQKISVLQKQWTETQKRKNNLVKRQQLIEQVTTSSQIRRQQHPVKQEEAFVIKKRSSEGNVSRLKRVRSESPLANKNGDSTIIITVNEEVEEDPEPPVPAPMENEDFLVTITTGKKGHVTIDDRGIEDKILSERQQELEGDGDIEDSSLETMETPGKLQKRKPEDTEDVPSGNSSSRKCAKVDDLNPCSATPIE